MKKLLFTLLLFGLFSLNAQTITELKEQITSLQHEKKILVQKNDLLIDKIDFCNLYNNSKKEVKSFNSDFEFKVIECIGNSIEQTVEVTVTIKHSLPHQQLSLYTGSKKPVAYSEIGTNYDFKNAIFPEASSGVGVKKFNLPTNLLIQGKLVFRNILPQTEKFSLINGIFDFKNKDGGGNRGQGEFEIRELKIIWK